MFHQVYLQRTKQEEADSENMIEINNELDQLVEIQSLLNTEFSSYNTLSEPKPGILGFFHSHI